MRGAALFAAARGASDGAVARAPRGGLAAAPQRGARGGGLAMRIADVTAHALGFVVVSAEGHHYINEVMIPRNARLPAQAT